MGYESRSERAGVRASASASQSAHPGRSGGDRLPVLAAGAGLLLIVLLICPDPRSFGSPQRVLDSPLDAALRVPHTSVLLTGASTSLEPGDRVLRVGAPGSSGVRTPRNRSELLALLSGLPTDGVVQVSVARHGTSVEVPVLALTTSSAERAASNWLVVLLGGTLLIFGFLVYAGSRHPVAAPVFLLSLCLGTLFLSLLDQVRGADAGLLGIESLRTRVGLMALGMTPAALLHLAMRYPVVGMPFRGTTFPGLVYGTGLLLSAFSQVRLFDGALVDALERIAIGTAYLAGAMLVAASAVHLRGMNPIESSRTRALLWGFGIGGATPLLLAFQPELPSWLHQGLLLGVLAIPAALGWAIVRYRLLDPSTWFAELLLRGMVGVSALVLVTLAISTGASLATGTGWSLSKTMAVALPSMLLFPVLRVSLYHLLGVRLRGRGALGRVLDDVARDLAGANTPDAVRRELIELIRNNFDASDVCQVAAKEEPRPEHSRLARRGWALWKSKGAPERGVVMAAVRSEDPGPGQPEVMLPLFPSGGSPYLVVLAARRDALPYDVLQLEMLEGVSRIATLALGNAATTGELGERVAEKTASLEDALSERSRMLQSAQAICESEFPEEVRKIVHGFASRDESMPTRTPKAPGPHETAVRIIGDLALTRLELVQDLKREVEAQASEIAEITSRRMNAEFVREVAHELRKPTEEVRNLSQRLDRGEAAAGEVLPRIRRGAQEMCRRLDLLLFHSGLHLTRHRVDLVRIIDDAVERASAVHDDRRYRVGHADPRVPLVGDASRLLSVVENLVDNAALASAGGSVEVRSWLELQPEGGWACFEIEDDGQGIAPEHLGSIFEPGVSFRDGGFGLGLALCHEIVRRHDGVIEVESEPGCTVFRVRLPQFSLQESTGAPT